MTPKGDYDTLRHSASYFLHSPITASGARYRPVHDTDELRQRLVATWAEFQQNMMYDATDQWRKNWKHFEQLL